jgi:hypothetical protein
LSDTVSEAWGRANIVAQVVECLPSKHKALSSNFNTAEKGWDSSMNKINNFVLMEIRFLWTEITVNIKHNNKSILIIYKQ